MTLTSHISEQKAKYLYKHHVEKDAEKNKVRHPKYGQGDFSPKNKHNENKRRSRRNLRSGPNLNFTGPPVLIFQGLKIGINRQLLYQPS